MFEPENPYRVLYGSVGNNKHNDYDDVTNAKHKLQRLGIDRKSELILGGPYDYLAIISNGAEWHITSSNRMAGNTQFSEVSGTIDIDMSVDTYLISAYVGAVTCRLPPANAAKAIGRTITIKKTDATANAVTIIEQGGSGPDNATKTLASQYNAITIVSEGAAWHVISQY